MTEARVLSKSVQDPLCQTIQPQTNLSLGRIAPMPPAVYSNLLRDARERYGGDVYVGVRSKRGRIG